MYNLYHGNSEIKSLFYSNIEKKDIYKVINFFCKSINFPTYYLREQDVDGIISYDYGSHCYFFYLIEEDTVSYKSKKEYIYDDLYHKLIYINNYYKYNIGGVFLQGSQNYDMDVNDGEYQSDIDVKLIVIPTFDDLVCGTEVNKVITMPDDSHVECKDIRKFKNLWFDANTTYLEILYTRYKIILNNDIRKIFEDRDNIVTMNENKFLSSTKGMQQNKLRMLTHSYPNNADEIEKIGYSKKQLYHIFRLLVLIEDIYCNNKSYGESLIPVNCDKMLMLNFKIVDMPLEKAISLANYWVDELNELVLKIRNEKPQLLDKNNNINKKTFYNLQNNIYQCIKNAIYLL